MCDVCRAQNWTKCNGYMEMQVSSSVLETHTWELSMCRWKRTFWAGYFFMVGCCPMHRSILGISNISGIYQLEISSTPQVVTINNVFKYCQLSLGDKINVPSWEPLDYMKWEEKKADNGFLGNTGIKLYPWRHIGGMPSRQAVEKQKWYHWRQEIGCIKKKEIDIDVKYWWNIKSVKD